MQAPTCNYNSHPAIDPTDGDTASGFFYPSSSKNPSKKKNDHESFLKKSGKNLSRQRKRRSGPIVSQKVSASHASVSQARLSKPKKQRIHDIYPDLVEDAFLSLISPQFTFDATSLDNYHSPGHIRLKELHLTLDAISDSSDSIDIVGLPASNVFDIVTILDSPKLSDNHYGVEVGDNRFPDGVIFGKERRPLQDDISLALSIDPDDLSLSSDASDLVMYLLDRPRQLKNHNVEEDNDVVELPPADVSDLVRLRSSADEFSLSDDLDLSFDENLVV